MRSVSLSLLNVWTIVVFAVVSSIYAVTAKLNPVVIVPGLGGSAMEAKLSGQSKRFRDCRTNSSWYTIWFSESQALARYDCFLRNIKLYRSKNAASSGDNDGFESLGKIATSGITETVIYDVKQPVSIA